MYRLEGELAKLFGQIKGLKVPRFRSRAAAARRPISSGKAGQ
jgi:hypothetical protein